MSCPEARVTVQRLRTLAAEATPGPWEAREMGAQVWARGLCIFDDYYKYAGRRDAALIVGMRNSLDSLLSVSEVAAKVFAAYDVDGDVTAAEWDELRAALEGLS